MRARVAGLRTAVAAVVGVTVLAVAADLAAHQPAPPARARFGVVTELPGLPATLPAVDDGGPFPWFLLVAALAVVVVGAVVVWLGFREGVGMEAVGRRLEDLPGAEQEHARRTAELAALAELALADAAADLERGADPREVVVACWVRIELTAESLGQERRPAETATDVARRWLAGSADRAAVDDLAALYHLARYSTHPMTEAHRDRARAALRRVLGVPA